MNNLETELRNSLAMKKHEKEIYQYLIKDKFNSIEYEDISKSISYVRCTLEYTIQKKFNDFHKDLLLDLKQNQDIKKLILDKGISEMNLYGADIYLKEFYTNQDIFINRLMLIAKKENIDSALKKEITVKTWIPNYLDIYKKAIKIINDIAIADVALKTKKAIKEYDQNF